MLNKIHFLLSFFCMRYSTNHFGCMMLWIFYSSSDVIMLISQGVETSSGHRLVLST